jgi:hypothetical protein
MDGKAGSELEIEMGGWWMWLFVSFRGWLVVLLMRMDGWFSNAVDGFLLQWQPLERRYGGYGYAFYMVRPRSLLTLFSFLRGSSVGQ